MVGTKIIIGPGDKGRRVFPGYENGTIMVIYQTRLEEMGGPRHRLRSRVQV